MAATQLSGAIAARRVSCGEVMTAYLDRIERLNPVYNAIVALVDRDQLMAQAKAADRELDRGLHRGWLHGIPMAVKDLAHVKGLVTSFGFRGLADAVAGEDSLFVARLRQAGAIFIGKTNTPEFGLGSQTYNHLHGTTGNAYNPKLSAGGSSGGAAVALATHMLPLADGSDLMGSLRNPAAYNNILGFRPSQGRVPHDDADLFLSQLATEGPMGRTVEDTARLLETMSGHEPRFPLSRIDEFSADPHPLATELSGLRLAYLGDYEGYLATEPGLLELCDAAMQPLLDAGVFIEKTTPPFSMAELWDTWLTLRHWTVCGKLKPFYDDREARELLKPEAIWEIEGGLGLTGLELTRATRSRSAWYRALLTLFERFDFLVLPSAQVFPFEAEVRWPKEVGGRAMDTYHRWMEVSIGGTLAGCPVVNVPAGFDSRGRAMGLQVMGRPGDDLSSLQFAEGYCQLTDHLKVEPSVVMNADG